MTKNPKRIAVQLENGSFASVVIRQEVIIEAHAQDKSSSMHHTPDNHDWDAVATAILIFYQKGDLIFDDLLSRLRKSAFEYINMRESIKKILKSEDCEYKDRESILARL